MDEADKQFYAQMSKNSLVFAQELHNGGLRHYQTTVNQQIDNMSNGINDNALSGAVAIRSAQPPILPGVAPTS